MLAQVTFALAFASSAFAGSLIPRSLARACGTSITAEKLLAAESHFSANRVVSNLSASKKAATIPVSLLSTNLVLIPIVIVYLLQ